ncbi:hypothetical protein WA026_012842 [Henosepilachna vigintioctopunctata]|uniref:Sensory neuron membrane protein 2 n=1 Tax=Henosepilachna vigintioctopunctata TaxID=420089 RepID=A0AAW1TS11_9CUCU
MKFVLQKNTLIYVSCGGLLMLILGVILGYKIFPKIVEKKVWEQAVLANNTQQWELFKKLPFPFTFKVYIFNVDNPEGILLGEKPKVTEKGPFVYDAYHWKTDISWNDDEISFFEWTRFEFNAGKSGKWSDNDEITVLNAAYNGLFITVEELSPSALEGISSVTEGVFGEYDNLFMKIKVKDYLFGGYPICVNPGDKGFLVGTICGQMKAKVGKGLRMDGNRILAAQMYHKNMTHLGRFTVNSGLKVKEKVSTLVKYNSKPHIETWRGGNESDCNKIRGVVTFPPFIRKDMKFDTFGEDICRMMTLSYNSTEKVKGIPGYKFTAMNDSFETVDKKAENLCYCVNRSRTLDGSFSCLRNGLLDLTTCIGTQVILSFPHLMHADQSYLDSVIGLLPNSSLHETFVTLEPITGTPLRLAKRVQFNMFLRAIEGVSVIENLTNSLLPLFWIEEGLELPDPFTDMIKKELLRKLFILDILKYTMIVMGIAAVVVPGFLLIYMR